MNRGLEKQFVNLLLTELSFPDKWDVDAYEYLIHKPLDIKIIRDWNHTRPDYIRVKNKKIDLSLWNQFRIGWAYNRVKKAKKNKINESNMRAVTDVVYDILKVPTTQQEVAEAYQLGSWKDD